MNFKSCPLCRTAWESREDFLRDPSLELIGHMANLADPEEGMFLFHHWRPGCRTSLALKVKDFSDMFTRACHEEDAFGTEDCDGHCARVDDLRLCLRPCRRAFIREVAQMILCIHEKAVNEKPAPHGADGGDRGHGAPGAFEEPGAAGASSRGRSCQ